MQNDLTDTQFTVDSFPVFDLRGEETRSVVLNMPAVGRIKFGDPSAVGVICRTVIPRLPVSSLGRLLIGIVIEDCLFDRIPEYEYAELGAILGKGADTVERVAADLRHRGLMSTARIGNRGHKLRFSCNQILSFVRKTAGVTTGKQNAPSVPVAHTEPEESGIPYHASSTPALAAVAHSPLGETGFAADDHPEWPEVPLDWRERNGIPAPEADRDSWCIPYGVKPWLGPVPSSGGRYDLDKLRRKPYQLYTDGELHARCLADEPQGAPDSDGSFEGEEIDCSAEQEASNRAKVAEGRHKDADQEFDISSGTDTDESDIMVGVHHEIGV